MTETKGKTIFQLIPEASGKIGAIPKSKKNNEQNYMFRGIDDFLTACNRVFSDVGIFIVPEVLEKEQTSGVTKNGTAFLHIVLTVKYTIYAADGSNIIAVVKGEARDYADKAINKCMSAAFKYMLMQVFCVATQDIADANKEHIESAAPVVLPKPEPKKELTPAAKLAAIPAAVANLKDLAALNVFYARCQPILDDPANGLTAIDYDRFAKIFADKAAKFGAKFSGQLNKFVTEDET